MADCSDNLLRPFLRGFLDSVDIAGKKALVNAEGAGDFGNVQPGEALEDICNGVVRVRLGRNIETADVDILVDFIPMDIISVQADFKLGALLGGSLEKQRKCLQRTAVGIALVGKNIDPTGVKPKFYDCLHIFSPHLQSKPSTPGSYRPCTV